MDYKRYSVNARRAFCLGLVSLTAANVLADVIAVDSAVPAIMDAPNGSEANPSQYIIGNTEAFNASFSGSVEIGRNFSWNQLLIRSGSTFSVGQQERILLGSGNANNNEILLTGAGSRLGGSSNSLLIGDGSDGNRLSIEDGAVADAYYVNVGSGQIYGKRSDGNGLTVSGQGSGLTVALSLNIGSMGSNNRMRVTDGGAVSAFMLSVGGGYTIDGIGSDGNTVEISGSGSRLDLYYAIEVGVSGYGNKLSIEDGAGVTAGRLTIGALYSDADEDAEGMPRSGDILVSGRDSMLEVDGEVYFGQDGDNTLTVEDGGLIRLYDSDGYAPLMVFDSGAGATANYLRIKDGFFAWEGDMLELVGDLLIDGRILAWNPLTGSWENALTSTYFQYDFYASDADALAATGYAGLGGYTILSSAIPEPGTYAAILGVLSVAGAAFLRHRNRSQS